MRRAQPRLRTAAEMRRGRVWITPVAFGRHPPRGEPERPGGDHERPVRPRQRLADGFDRTAIRIGRVLEAAREGDVVLEGEVDHTVRGGRGPTQSVEIINRAALYLGPGGGEGRR